MNLASNLICAGLEHLAALPHLAELDLGQNRIANLHDVANLSRHSARTDAVAAAQRQLERLRLIGNPVCRLPNYRHAVFLLLPRLVQLDKAPDGLTYEPVQTESPAQLTSLRFVPASSLMTIDAAVPPTVQHNAGGGDESGTVPVQHEALQSAEAPESPLVLPSSVAEATALAAASAATHRQLRESRTVGRIPGGSRLFDDSAATLAVVAGEATMRGGHMRTTSHGSGGGRQGSDMRAMDDEAAVEQIAPYVGIERDEGEDGDGSEDTGADDHAGDSEDRGDSDASHERLHPDQAAMMEDALSDMLLWEDDLDADASESDIDDAFDDALSDVDTSLDIEDTSSNSSVVGSYSVGGAANGMQCAHRWRDARLRLRPVAADCA